MLKWTIIWLKSVLLAPGDAEGALKVEGGNSPSPNLIWVLKRKTNQIGLKGGIFYWEGGDTFPQNSLKLSMDLQEAWGKW